MNGFEVGFIVAFVFFGGMCLGAVVGHKSERAAWVSRAMPGNTTPHHCDGEFYYVVPERVFAEYTRRKVVPPRGGSGTPPRVA